MSTENTLITFEEVSSDYLDREVITTPPRIMYRWHEGERRYFTIDPDLTVRWYLSTTTAWKYALPKSEFLIQWMATYPGGYKAACDYRDERADYGTFLHILISEFLATGHVDLDRIAEMTEVRRIAEGWRWDTAWWEKQLKKDLLAFAQFASDYNVRPIAIEIVLGSDALQTAGAIDIVCRMTVSEQAYAKGDIKPFVPPVDGKKKRKKDADAPREIIGLGDWKSSLSGFYPDADYQVATNNLLWLANYPDEDMRPDFIFLWRPRDWRGKPTYELRDATDAVSQAEAKLGLRWARRRATIKPGPVKEYGGKLELRATPGESNVRQIDADQYVYDTVIRPKLERAAQFALHTFEDDGGPVV